MIYKLSDVTKNYLVRYEQIIDDMVTNMNMVRMDDSISQYFAAVMIPHHAAAIQMSENILDYTTNLDIQNAAHSIIDSSIKDIEILENIRNTCKDCKNDEREIKIYLHNHNIINKQMLNAMEGASTSNDINKDFLTEMIPHHEGAIKMSKNVLNFDICDELIQQAEHMISSQEESKKQLLRILNTLK